MSDPSTLDHCTYYDQETLEYISEIGNGPKPREGEVVRLEGQYWRVSQVRPYMKSPGYAVYLESLE